MALWLTRAGSSGEYENKFLDDSRIYLTWDELDIDLDSLQEREELYEHLERLYPEGKQAKYRNWAGQIWTFVSKMEQGDWVVLPSKQKSYKASIHIGEIQSKYIYDSSLGSPYFHYREVDWFAEDIPRSNFDQDILYSMGAFMTVCQIRRNDAEARIRAMADNNWQPVEHVGLQGIDDNKDSGDSVIDLELMANDEIAKYLKRKFKGHRMTRIIEAILQAKGYITYRSQEGPDKGVDILAAPEPLGFGRPRICIQVKTGDTPVDRPTLDQLLGTMQNFNADQGLLVSWSGFKSSVDKEVPVQFFRVRLWDQKTIIDELLSNYEKLEEEVRAEIPLKRIWTLALTEEGDI